MTKLPDLFPADKLGVIERMQLEWFYTRYTCEYYTSYLFGHFIMAAYASLPAYLTPDLLYKMWQNFGAYEWGGKPVFIDSLAVSDVLLAPFCHEVSYELFQMEENTRLSFQRWMNSDDPLWTNRKSYRPEQLADFIERYHDKPNNTIVREGAKYREDQLMEVKIYRNPREVANHYLNKLKEANQKGDEQEILAVINALTKAKEKQAYTNHKDKDRTFIDLFPENQLLLWKHVLQHNNNTFANLLEKTKVTGGTSLHLKVEGQSCAIQVKSKDTSLVTKLDSLVESKNWMIIIGCSKQDELNCSLFSETCRRETRVNWSIRIFEGAMGREELLQKLQDRLQEITPADNLMLYISALDAQISSDDLLINLNGEIIHEDELFTPFSTINPSSFTFILQCDYLPTLPWLDVNKVGYALYTSSVSSPSDNKRRHYELERPSAFTKILCDVISIYGGKLSNRQLYTRMLASLNDDLNHPSLSNSPLQSKKYDVLNVDQELLTPQLFSNRNTYYRQFASALNQSDRLQHNLRLSGYLDKPASVGWDDETEAAFKKFLEEAKLGDNREQAAAALEAKVAANGLEQKPILLFVFSDPERTLPAIAKEIAAIKSVLKSSALDGFNKIKIIQNKSLKEVGDFVTGSSSRNRIQLFYYSGFDAQGWPNFGDGAMSLALWCDWLAYQDKLELVVFNTCNSAAAAGQLTQIGVSMAIGNDHLVTDEQSAAFGSMLIETIVKKGRLSGLPVQ